MAGAIRVPFIMQAGASYAVIDKLVKKFQKLTGSVGKANLVMGAFATVGTIAVIKTLSDATKEAIKFQTEMAGLTKILGTEFAQPIGEALGNLSTQLPIAREELINVAETAARLGVRGTGNIVAFTETMAKMGVATNISAEVAADALARVAKQTQLPISQIDNLGSVINELSNTMATSASEIVDSMRRSAPELARLGANAFEIAALAATLNTVSESASRAGTRLRRFAQDLATPDKLETFAAAVGKTRNEFEKMLDEDVVGTITTIVTEFEKGGEAADILASGLDARVRLAIASLAQVLPDMKKALADANREAKLNNSLNEETDRIIGLVISKQTLLRNTIAETRREIGERFIPVASSWYDLLLDIAGATEAIADSSPLENMIPDEELRKLEEAELHMDGLLRKGLLWLNAVAKFQAVRFFGGTAEALDDVNTAFNQLFERRIYQGLLRDFSLDLSAFGQQFIKVGRLIRQEEGTDFGAVDRSIERVERLKGTFRGLAAVAELGKEPLEKYGRELNNLIHLWDTSVITGEEFEEQLKRLALDAGIGTRELAIAQERLANAIQLPEGIDNVIEGLAKQALAARKLGADAVFATDEWSQLVSMIKEGEEAGENVILLTTARDAILEYVAAIKQAQREQAELEKTQNMAEKAIAEVTERYKKWNEAGQENRDWVQEHLRDLKIQRVALTQGAAAARRMELRQKGLRASTIDNIIATEQELEFLKRQKTAREESAKSIERINAEIDKKRADAQLASIQSRFALLNKIAQGAADSTIEFFDSIIDGSERAGEAFIKMLQDIASELAKGLIAAEIAKFIGPSGIDLLGILNFGGDGQDLNVGSLISQGGPPIRLAGGGTLNAGQLSLVGERGPELFVPNVAGTVVPNHELGGNQVNVAVNNNFNIRALDGPSVRQVLMKEEQFMAKRIVRRINQSTALKQGRV